MHGPTDAAFAAYVAFYAPCNTTHVDDTDVGDRRSSTDAERLAQSEVELKGDVGQLVDVAGAGGGT